jgi:hypothetical protein
VGTRVLAREALGQEQKVPVVLPKGGRAAHRVQRVGGLMLTEVVTDPPVAAPMDHLGKVVKTAEEMPQ